MSIFHRRLWVFKNIINIAVDMCIWIQSKIDIRALELFLLKIVMERPCVMEP